MNGHFQDIRKLIVEGKSSDSFAAHFALHVKKHWNNDFRPLFLRQKMNFYIKWLGNPIACNKTFGKYDCKLCMKERLELIWGFEKMKKSNNNNKNRNGNNKNSNGKNNGKTPILMNDNADFYASCKHRTRFHNFAESLNDTDELLCEKII